VPLYPSGSSHYHGSNGDEDDDDDEECEGLDRGPPTASKNLRNKSGVNINQPKLQMPAQSNTEPLYEEDVIDGFAIISLSSYDDLEVSRSGLLIC